MAPPSSDARTPKGERTRQLILETALESFQAKGYDATTMRGIAKQAGLSVGNAYYYFPSKEHIVQAFYGRIAEDAILACSPVLDEEQAFAKRLRGVLRRKLEVIEPYHRFSGAIAAAALDPKSPISPFSSESSPVRAAVIAFYERLVEGSKERIHKELRPELPEMLWLVGEGLALYWVYDESPGRERTLEMIDDVSELLGRLVKMAGLPLLGPVRKLVLRMTGKLSF